MRRKRRRRRSTPVAVLSWVALVVIAYLVAMPSDQPDAMAVLSNLLLWGSALLLIGGTAYALMRVMRVAAGGEQEYLSGAGGAPLVKLAPAGADPAVDAPPVAEWSIDLLRRLEWKRFEQLCEGFWRTKGYPARLTETGPERGIDLIIGRRDGAGGDGEQPFAVIQCRAWQARQIGIDAVRTLWTVKQHTDAKLAIYYAMGGFTTEAMAFAAGKHLKLIDGPALLVQLMGLAETQRQALLAAVADGDYRTPTCPHCDIKMQLHAGRHGGPDYWECRNHRRCRSHPIQVGY